jgi:hypothetical protein
VEQKNDETHGGFRVVAEAERQSEVGDALNKNAKSLFVYGGHLGSAPPRGDVLGHSEASETVPWTLLLRQRRFCSRLDRLAFWGANWHLKSVPFGMVAPVKQVLEGDHELRGEHLRGNQWMPLQNVGFSRMHHFELRLVIDILRKRAD